MNANLTELHREMLAVLLERGADTGKVHWARLMLRVKGSSQVLIDLQSAGLVSMVDDQFPNPGFMLTEAGVTEARKATP